MSLFETTKRYLAKVTEPQKEPSRISLWGCQWDRRKEGILKLDMCPGIPNREKCKYCECETDIEVYKARLKEVGLL